MEEFLKIIENTIVSRRLLSRNEKIIVGVSGGLDSVLLLRVLKKLAPRYRWKLIVAHLNHSLRGKESDADENFVRKLAQQLRLPFECKSVEVKNFAKSEGISIEMAAREVRHGFLAKLARENKACLALAHHADDQVELFFLRLLRGAGSGSLAGMKWAGPSPADSSIKIVRPFLGTKKSDIQEAAGPRMKYCKDVSNEDQSILRNSVRVNLLPFLRECYQPNLEAVILRTMEVLKAEDEFIQESLESHSSREFNALPLALQRREIVRQLQALSAPCGFEDVEHFRTRENIPRALGPDLMFIRKGSVLEKVQAARDDHSVEQEIILLNANQGVGNFFGLAYSWNLDVKRDHIGPKNAELFDALKIGTRIILRFWQLGDSFHMIGSSFPKKLQDIFTNLKIPRQERRKRVVAATEKGEIFWVEGLRIGHGFRLTESTKRVLKWQFARDLDALLR